MGTLHDPWPSAHDIARMVARDSRITVGPAPEPQVMLAGFPEPALWERCRGRIRRLLRRR